MKGNVPLVIIGKDNWSQNNSRFETTQTVDLARLPLFFVADARICR